MPKEIFLPYGTTGLTTLYASIRRPSDGQRWYTVTPAFEAYSSGHVAAGYAIALTEEGTTGNYYADFPTGITAAGRYEVVARNQAGGSPAWPADAVVGTGDILWSGSAVVVPVAAGSTGKAPATIAAGDLATDSITAASVKADAVTKIQIAIVSGGAITTASGAVSSVTTVTTTTNLTNAPGAGDFTAAMKTSLNASTPQANLATWLGSAPNALQSGRVDVYLGAVATGLGTPLATLATALWTDTTSGDFTVSGSPGKLLMGQLAGAFTGTTSVYTTAALANAPTGGGGGDPWATALPGSYSGGTAGAILGGTLPANIVQVNGVTPSTPSTIDSNLVSVNGTTFSGANVPTTLVNPEALVGTVVSASTTSVTISVPSPGVPTSGRSANAYAADGLARYLSFTSGANRSLLVLVTGSSYSGSNLTLTFDATADVVAATAGDTVQVD